MEISAEDRRSAHRRVGTGAVLAFLALLLFGLTRNSATAGTEVPAPAPAIQPADPGPAQPWDHRFFPREHRGDGDGHGAPAPGTGSGGSTT